MARTAPAARFRSRLAGDARANTRPAGNRRRGLDDSVAARMEHRFAGAPVVAARAPQTRAGRRTHIAEGLRCASLTWGVLAFGAVYPWGYWPLAVACGAAGVLALWSSGRLRLAAGTRGVAAVMAGVAGAAPALPVPAPPPRLAR